MKLLSIQVGLPKTIQYRGRPVTTGIFKSPIEGPAFVRTLNLDGDGQADLTVHGGHDKAVYAYGFDVYPAWRARRPHDSFDYGAFGENLTLASLAEDQTYIGDTFRLGEVILQAAQPRFPCYKVGVKFNDPSIIREFMEVDRPGVYFRVLQEGKIQVGDELTLLDRADHGISIHRIFALVRGAATDDDELRRILAIDALPASVRRMLSDG